MVGSETEGTSLWPPDSRSLIPARCRCCGPRYDTRKRFNNTKSTGKIYRRNPLPEQSHIKSLDEECCHQRKFLSPLLPSPNQQQPIRRKAGWRSCQQNDHTLARGCAQVVVGQENSIKWPNLQSTHLCFILGSQVPDRHLKKKKKKTISWSSRTRQVRI